MRGLFTSTLLITCFVFPPESEHFVIKSDKLEMSYLESSYYGEPQKAYNPPVGPPPATREQIEEYDKAKRKSNILIIIVVVMVIVLIALLIAVVIVGFRSTYVNQNAPELVPSTLKIFLTIRDTSTTYVEADYGDPTTTSYQELTAQTCGEIETVVTAKGYMMGGCSVSSMRDASPESGILMDTYLTILSDGTQSENDILLGLGNALLSDLQVPLEVKSTTIKLVSVEQS